MRIVKVFWGLDSSLAYARHFPAINWLTSYSLYLDTLRPWYDSKYGARFLDNRNKAMAILGEEAELQEIVKLVGQDSLSAPDRLTLETAKMLREDFLQQNAFVDLDSYSSYEKQGRLLEVILQYDSLCRDALQKGVTDIAALFDIEARERIGRAKMTPADEYDAQYDEIVSEMVYQIEAITRGGESQ
jgi:V/A-type H+-transporting ATPase subunit A